MFYAMPLHYRLFGFIIIKLLLFGHDFLFIWYDYSRLQPIYWVVKQVSSHTGISKPINVFYVSILYV